MLVNTVMFDSFAAATTFSRVITSSAETARSPGAQICEMRTARKPASASRSIWALASTNVVERTASSVAPSTRSGPPAWAVGTSASHAAGTTENRRRDPHIASATVAMAMAVRLEDQLKQVPAKPGVYLFRDAKGAVL